MADNTNFGAAAGVTRSGLDFDDAVVNFGNFLRKQLLHEIRMRTAQQDLRATIFALHLHDQRPNAVATTDNFARNLLVTADNAFSTAKVDNNMAELNRLYDASDDFAGAVLKLFKLALALCIAHLLEDNLLCGLRIDTAEINSWQRVNNKVANNGALLQLVCLLQVNLLEVIFDVFNNFHNAPQAKIASLRIQFRANVIFCAITCTGSALDGFFQRLNDNSLVDHLFGSNRIGNCKQFSLVRGNRVSHVLSLPVLRREWGLPQLRRHHRC